MHEADDAYSIRSTWSCYWLDQFLTLALNTLILSIFYISVDLSTNYFAHFSGCRASFACSCHYPRMLCHVFWSQVDYKIVCFISASSNLFNISSRAFSRLVILSGAIPLCLSSFFILAEYFVQISSHLYLADL